MIVGKDEILLERAVSAAQSRERPLQEALDDLPGAIYVTDQHGVITYFNKACIALAGRTPLLHHDKWCVTWRLFTLDGAHLPHDQCPMATAIRTRRQIRGEEAIAERPDGSRFHFIPYPTPLFDRDGAFIGAVNLLIDMTVRRQSLALCDQAARCRRLATAIDDKMTIGALLRMADEYEGQANQLDHSN